MKTLIIKNYKMTEYKRNIKMNGFTDMSTYLPFSYHYNLFNIFKKLVNKLDEHNIKYFLSSGGLIGYFRHNKGLIPWDDDIDICVFEKDKELVRKCLQEIVNEDDTMYISQSDNKEIDKICQNAIFIDIFYLQYYKDNNYYHYSCKTRNYFVNEYIYEDEIFPLNKVDYYLYFPNGEICDIIKVNIPNKSIEYLDRAYKNWQTKYVVSDFHNILLIILNLNNLTFIKNLKEKIYRNKFINTKINITTNRYILTSFN
jgi:phosphorylcholine metabolism protein LicD